MIGAIPYKGGMVGKGSELYVALTDNRMEDAKRIHADTTARADALLAGLTVPKVVYGLDKYGKRNGKWSIEAPDAFYDNNGRLKEKK